MFTTFSTITSSIRNTNASASSIDIELVSGSIVTYLFNTSTVSGSTVKNLASGSYDLTMNAGATTTSQTGQEGTACLVITTSGYTTSSFSKTINISASTGLSISFWFKSINFNQYAGPLILGLNGGQFTMFWNQLTSTQIKFTLLSGTSYSTDQFFASSVLFNGAWTHCCLVIQSTSTTLFYVNNVLNNTVSFSIPASTSLSSVQIGDTNAGRTNGYFDGFRIFNRALNTTDIGTLYNSGVVN